MLIKLMVLDETSNAFKTKQGAEKLENILSARDCGDGGRCSANFEYVLTQSESDSYRGKLRDEKIVVDVKEIKAKYDGSLKLIGHITEIAGKPVNGKAENKTPVAATSK